MRFKDILNISKAEITFLVIIVAITGFLSAPSAASKAVLLVPLVIAGSLASMSAAIFNNIYDRDIDSKMKRTASRRYYLDDQSSRKFFGLAAIMLVLSTFIGVITINYLATLFILLGFCSYVFLYTAFLKRRTSWNIVIGGIAGSFPAMAGWAAVTGGVSWTALYIALLVFMWTPTHFWSLAIGLKDDYASAGVPMLPSIVKEEKASMFVIINTVVLIIYTLLPLFFRQIGVGILFIPAAVVMDAIMIALILKAHRKLPDRKWFRQAFHFSNVYLLAILISVWWIAL